MVCVRPDRAVWNVKLSLPKMHLKECWLLSGSGLSVSMSFQGAWAIPALSSNLWKSQESSLSWSITFQNSENLSGIRWCRGRRLSSLSSREFQAKRDHEYQSARVWLWLQVTINYLIKSSWTISSMQCSCFFASILILSDVLLLPS